MGGAQPSAVGEWRLEGQVCPQAWRREVKAGEGEGRGHGGACHGDPAEPGWWRGRQCLKYMLL